ncbi:MAG TPA: biopolymer transporter ExbD [Nostocaceae cyanobacterium]|nr:biopolymer transporter ExbD [Nostocaceae cyanobacterium]
MRLPEEPDIPPQINIVPMIDIIFSILTFFIMSTLFLTKLEGLPVNLPKASTATAQNTVAPITVSITQTGDISLNDRQISLDALQEEVNILKGANNEAVVIINADKLATHGQVVAVMDSLRQVPGVKLAIATEK